MIPLGDSVGHRRTPVATGALIAVCALVFVYELTLKPAALDAFVLRWGAVPRVIVAAVLGDPRVPRLELLTLVTSQFLHAGVLHLGGNMLFLWVFGRAVEDRLGSALYLLVYLLIGALAGLVQCVVSAGESVPLIGASGAIAGVLGLYFLTYPGAWVRVLLPVLFFFWTFDLPAVLVLAFWFVSQFFAGITAITHATRVTADIAVWAHVAGFLIGAVSARMLPMGSAGAAALPGRRASATRADVPGPARLVSSIADLAALLLGARLLLRFLGLAIAPVFAATNPVVVPLHEVLPDVRVFGGVLETSTLAAILTVYVVAGLVSQTMLPRRPAG